MNAKQLLQRASLLGLAELALTASSAQAQLFTYHAGDLVAAFRRSGSSDLEVDLGSISTFKNATGPLTFGTAGLAYDISSQLNTTFAGGLDGVSVSVFGTVTATTVGAGVPVNTSWLTLGRSDPNVLTTAPFRYTASKTATIQSSISGILGDNGASSGALTFAPTASYPPSSATALVIPTTGTPSANSFTTKYTATGGLLATVASPGIENTTAAGFSTTPGSRVVSDLYEYQPGSPTLQAQYLGSFTFANDGSLTFTPVPEPSTWALAGLGGVLLLILQQRRRASTSYSPTASAGNQTH